MARASVTALGAASAFAIGTWIAFGSVALYGPDTSPRIALPGPPWILITAAVSAFAYVFLRRPTPRDAAPLWLPAVALLPWLPLPLPAAALIWTGPLARGLVFLAIATVIVPLVRQLWRRGFSPAVRGDDRNNAQAEAWAYARLGNAQAEAWAYARLDDARAKARAYVPLAFGLAAVLYLAAA